MKYELYCTDNRKQTLIDAIWDGVDKFHKKMGVWPSRMAIRADEYNAKDEYPKIPIEKLSTGLPPRHFRLYQ